MVNPFFKNHGPFNILDILKTLNIKDSALYESQNVADIKDLLNSKSGEITFFHSQKYKNLAKDTKASFCITTENLKDELNKNCKPLIVNNVLVSTSQITSKFYPNSIDDAFDDVVYEISNTKFKDT